VLALDSGVGRAGMIAASWQELYPTAYLSGHDAAYWLGTTIRQNITFMLSCVGRPGTLAGYLIGFVLANIPTLILLRSWRPPQFAIFSWLGIAGAIACAMLPFALAADWGRYTYLFVMTTFPLLLVGSAAQSRPRRFLPMDGAAAVALVFLYASTWRLNHYMGGGASALMPGFLFQVPASVRALMGWG
jgi:hypothetical protein